MAAISSTSCLVSAPLVQAESASSSTTNAATTLNTTISNVAATALEIENESKQAISSTSNVRPTMVASSSSTDTATTSCAAEGVELTAIHVTEIGEINSTTHVIAKPLGYIHTHYEYQSSKSVFIINSQAQLANFVKKQGLREEYIKRLDALIDFTKDNLFFLYLISGSGADVGLTYVSQAAQIGQDFKINLVSIPRNGFGNCAMAAEFLVLSIPKTDVSINKVYKSYADHKKDEIDQKLDNDYKRYLSDSNSIRERVNGLMEYLGLKSYNIHSYQQLSSQLGFEELTQTQKDLLKRYFDNQSNSYKIWNEMQARLRRNQLPSI